MCIRDRAYLATQQKELSGSAFRRMCKQEYLHYLRIREWQDLHGQLRHILRSLDLPFHWELSQFFLGANVGAVYFGDADESVDALIGRASDAVNEAALSGAHHRISESADRPPARIAPKYNLPRSVAH